MMRIVIILMMAVSLLSCTKENSAEFFPYSNHEQNDTTWYANPAPNAPARSIAAAFARAPLADSVSGSNGGTVMFGDSIRITFPGYFCQQLNGASINDKVRIEVISLASKGDMIRYNKPTMSYDHLLVTGGSMFIKATYNGQEVRMAPGKMIHINVANGFSGSAPPPQMSVFFGIENANISAVQDFTWVPWQDSSRAMVNGSVMQTASGIYSAYSFVSDRFRWVNCDYFFDTTQARTKLTVLTPLNFTNANTLMYAVFKNDNIVAQLTGDHINKNFYLQNAYVGKMITLVSISKINGQFFLGTKDITVTNNMVVNVQPQPVSQQAIDQFLGTL